MTKKRIPLNRLKELTDFSKIKVQNKLANDQDTLAFLIAHYKRTCTAS